MLPVAANYTKEPWNNVDKGPSQPMICPSDFPSWAKANSALSENSELEGVQVTYYYLPNMKLVFL